MDNKIKLGRPDSITVIENGNDLTFVRKHFHPIAFFLLLFCILWDGFIFYWYFGLPLKDGPLMAKLFPIGHVAVGIGLTYYTISLFINKTVIKLNNGLLIIKDHPLPMGNSKIINIDEIIQLYVKEKLWQEDGLNSSSYTLMAITKDERLIKIVKGLAEKEEGLFLEQELEEKLNILPKSVKGEVQ